VDLEAVFERHARADLLVLDDLGASKSTEWTEEINYRLVNHRYENELPTLFTSNVPPKELIGVLGMRVASRLVEMTTRVPLDGEDRRRAS
jgi:DNA replication protein DnaC